MSCAADKRVSVIDRTLTGTDPTRTETHLGVAGAKKLQEQKVVTEALSQSVKKTAEEAATAAVLALQAVPMSRALKSSLGNTLGEPKTLYSPKVSRPGGRRTRC